MKEGFKIIFINGRFLNMPITGVQRYALELFRSLDRLLGAGALPQAGIELVCLVPPDCHQDPGWKNIQVRRVGRLKGNAWEQIDLPWHAREHLLFSPANIGPFLHSKQVVTIHDASVYAFPQAYSFTFRTKYRLSFQRSVRAARKVITDSEFSKRELQRYSKMPPELIEVILLGPEHGQNIPADEDFLDRSGFRKKKYFLGVGSQSPHKNFSGLIEAFRQLNRPDVDLVLVGGKFGKVFQAMQVELPERTHQLGYLKDSELQALYQHAAGFVFPSFYEGFGLPVLEAMSAGCPVISSNAASLPEVGGDAVLYCDPASPGDIARQMAALLDSNTLREALCEKGFQQVRRFSWETTARKTWDVLRDCHGS